MTVIAQRLVIERDLFADLVDGLPQKMGQHIRAQRPGLLPGRRVARRRHPQRRLGRDRARLSHHRMQAAVTAREPDRLAAPQPPQLVDACLHRGFVVGRGVFRAQHEIIRLPARCDGKPGAPVRQVVDDRPFFGDARGVMQRGDTGSGAHAYVARYRRHGGAGDRRVGIGAAEGVKVPLGRPDGAKAVRVGVFRPLQQQFILVRPHAIVIAPVIEAEIHWPRRHGDTSTWRIFPGRDRCAHVVPGQYHAKPACQRPEQLEHRDVEGQAGHGQPCAGRIMRDPFIHAGEEIGDVAVLDHDALGGAGRSGRVDQIGEVLGGHAALGRAFASTCEARIGVEMQKCCRMRGQCADYLRLRDDDGRRAVGDVMRDAIGGIAGIERHVGAAGLENGQRPDDKIEGAAAIEPDGHAGADPHLPQDMCRAVRAGLERAVAELLILKYQRRRLGGPLSLGFDRVVDTGIASLRQCDCSPALQHLRLLGRRRDRQIAQGCVRGGHRRLGQMLQPCGDQLRRRRVQPAGVVDQRRPVILQHHRRRTAGDRAGRRDGEPQRGHVGPDQGVALHDVAQESGLRRRQPCGHRVGGGSEIRSHVRPERHPLRDMSRCLSGHARDAIIAQGQIAATSAVLQHRPGGRGRGDLPCCHSCGKAEYVRGLRPGSAAGTCQRHPDRRKPAQRPAPGRLGRRGLGHGGFEGCGLLRLRARQPVARRDQRRRVDCLAGRIGQP